MKATGLVRRIDDLGRLIIPKEVRRELRIKEGDPFEIFTHEGSVVFKPYIPEEDRLERERIETTIRLVRNIKKELKITTQEACRIANVNEAYLEEVICSVDL